MNGWGCEFQKGYSLLALVLVVHMLSLLSMGLKQVINSGLLFRRGFVDLCACFACCLSPRIDRLERVFGVRNPRRLRGKATRVSICVDKQGSAKPSCRGVRNQGGFWMILALFWGLFRIGEAQHPGPCSVDDWHFGIFNPSGLCSKTDQVVAMPGDVWVASETHLTKSGVTKLRTGLRALGSHYKYIVPGAPCSQRSSADVGIYSGVSLISAFPARPLPHDFCQDSFATSRIQVAGVQVGNQWIHVGMLYGVPKGKTHANALFQTEVLLEQLVDRVGQQVCGPRIVCGDFNFEEDCLYQTHRLRELGFVEVQTYAMMKWGLPQVPTGRGTKKLDQIWISRELQAQLLSIDVQHDWWPDHAIVQCRFGGCSVAQQSNFWRLPHRFPWPQGWEGQISFDPSLNLTEAFAKLWIDIEAQAEACVQSKGGAVPGVSKGRAQTLQPSVFKPRNVPCKLGRQGDINPKFHGASLMHARLFKQLRRVQALARLTAKHSFPIEKALDLWQAIKRAPGFAGGFCWWWMANIVDSPFEAGIPWFLPDNAKIQHMFEALHSFVREFENHLMNTRVTQAKDRRRQDLNVVFQDCGKEAPLAIDSLVKVSTGTIETVCPDDVSIIFHDPFPLLPRCPVISNGKPLDVIVHSHDQMWLSSIENLQPGDVVSQEQVHSSDNEIITALETVWRQRWIKLSHVQPGQWDQIGSFISHHFRPVEWSFPTITSQQFRRCVETKKRRAATGSDGISRLDMMNLPQSAVDAHVTLLSAVETQGSWPDQLCTGFVASLDKNKGQTDVDAYRPITIYPLVYRLWSSIRSRQALHCISTELPNSVFGGIPGKQAREVWFAMNQLIEMAHAESASLFGIVLDIRRAFNALPREPIWLLLHRLSFPSHLLRTWSAFVAKQVRRFKVRSSIGAAVPSCTGLPEGCGMSVFGMVLIDLLLDVWLTNMVPSPHRLFSFVDDWQVAFPNLDTFHQVWSAIEAFTRRLDLDLDLGKSYAWGAQTRDRPAMNDLLLSTTLASRILGAHTNFSFRPGNKTLVERINGMKPTWKRLGSSLSPLKAKMLAIRQLAWPRALHGIASVHLGSEHYGHLRTGALRGMKSARVGANPMLHLTSWSPLADPEFWAIVDTVRDARAQGNCDQLYCLLQQFSMQSSAVPSNGPTVILAKRLQRLGWNLSSQGTFVDSIGTIDVLNQHWDAVFSRMQWSWPRVMVTAVAHRKSYTGLQHADIDETRAMLAKFGEADQVFLRCGLDGTLYQDSQKDKQNRGQATLCIHCQQPDSFRHRLWECSTFASARASFQWTSLLPTLPPCLTSHGWAVIPPTWPALVRYFEGVAEPNHVVAAQMEGKQCHLFTDGACSHPTEPKLRYASFAVTVAGTSLNLLEHKLLLAGHVPGQHQTAYRGELYAMLVAIRFAALTHQQVCIWSDNKAVVRRVRSLQAGAGVKPNSSHSDLWGEIHTLLTNCRDRITICKVVSHGAGDKAQSDIEEWAFWHNALVDHAALKYNETRPPVFWELWTKVAMELEHFRKVHHGVLQVILQVGRMGSQLDRVAKQSGNFQAETAPSGGLEGIADNAPSQIPAAWTFSQKLIKHCTLSNLNVVQRWWLKHGVPHLTQTSGLAWISGLQLYVDFLLEHGAHGPFMVGGSGFLTM